MKTLLSPVIAVILAGCATTSPTEFRAPDGSVTKTVKCSSDPQKCFVSASESCKADGGTYRVISSHSNAGGALADVLPGPVTWYNMTYTCGPSDGRMPDFAFKGQQYVQPTTIIQTQPRARPSTTNCSRVGDYVSCSTY